MFDDSPLSGLAPTFRNFFSSIQSIAVIFNLVGGFAIVLKSIYLLVPEMDKHKLYSVQYTISAAVFSLCRGFSTWMGDRQARTWALNTNSIDWEIIFEKYM